MKTKEEILSTIIEAIRKCGTDIGIALCKEQPQIWKAVRLDGKGLSCNAEGPERFGKRDAPWASH